MARFKKMISAVGALFGAIRPLLAWALLALLVWASMELGERLGPRGISDGGGDCGVYGPGIVSCR